MVKYLAFICSIIVTGMFFAMPNAYALSGPEVYRMAKHVTAKIVTNHSQGSGVVIASNLIVTNCHVVGSYTSVQVEVLGHAYPANVIEENRKQDVCTLEISAKYQLQSIKAVRAFSTLQVGEQVFALGAPLDLEYSFSDGIIAQVRLHEEGEVIQFTAPIGNGSSGGGVFDSEGRLIGLSSFHISGDSKYTTQNTNFAWSISVFPPQAKAAVMSLTNSKAASTEKNSSPPVVQNDNGDDWNDAYQAQDYRRLMDLATKGITEKPKSWQAWLRYSQYLLLIDDLDQAEEAIKKTLYLSDNNNMALYVYALILKEKKDPIGVQHIKLLLEKNYSELAEKL